MEEVTEVNLMLDDYNRKKITMDMVNKFAKDNDRTSDSVLDDIYDKVKAFDLDTYSVILENYGLHGKELDRLYKSYNKIDLVGRAKLLKIIRDFEKGMFKYVGVADDNVDMGIARSNLERLIDDEILNTRERKG